MAFFKGLALGFPLERCMREGRQAIIDAQTRARWDFLEFPDWAIPVIFARSHGPSDEIIDEMVKVEPPENYLLGLTAADVASLRGSLCLSRVEDEIVQECGERPFKGRLFYIGRWPVPSSQFKEFLDVSGYRLASLPLNWERNRDKYEIAQGKATWPVAGLAYKDVDAYCEWRGVRLPTADEWELAARGPQRNLFCGGNVPDTKQYRFDCEEDAGPVSVYWSSGISGYGVRDMLGNVLEWTSTSAEREQVVMGGWWHSSLIGLLPSIRAAVDPRLPQLMVGFRVAKDA
jgi:formylglycine-generating enzyme required for sulfatase activity